MGKKAVVTGGSQGIGLAIVKKLEAEGFKVFPLDISQRDESLFCDVSDSTSVEKCADEIGPIDVLVNNAGVWKFSPLEDVDEDDFSKVLDVNLLGSFLCMKYFGKSMLTNGRGSIINIVSIAGAHANPSVGSYGPSKAALISLTQQAALEWGPRGVRCNAIGPGLVPTPGTGNVYDDASTREARSRAVPLQRLGKPEDIANAVAFLASDESAYINGQTIFVDGGLSKGLMPLLQRPEDLPN
jgi:NAD(P)-dependent dehydrogenase (short-subunit alcohol dehydrogenase family)